MADLQEPPLLEHTFIRKLGRGLSNIAFGPTELVSTYNSVNQRDGNSAGIGLGVVSGVQRTLLRMGAGFYEVMTFPFPSMRGSYRPVLPSTVPWVHGGYEEFPPELGFETRFNYLRVNSPESRIP